MSEEIEQLPEHEALEQAGEIFAAAIRGDADKQPEEADEAEEAEATEVEKDWEEAFIEGHKSSPSKEPSDYYFQQLLLSFTEKI